MYQVKTKLLDQFEFLSSGVICTCPGAKYMYQLMKKIYIKSKFEAVFLKFTAIDQSNESLLRCLKLTPWGLSLPGLYI